MRGSSWLFLLALGGVILSGGLGQLLGAAESGAGCHVARTCPAKDGSYAWRPLRSSVALRLTCYLPLRGPQPPAAFNQLLDYGGAGYECRLPTPADSRGHGSI